MRTLKFLRNKNTHDGFTILECILAVGILSVVLASLVGLQSSIIFVAQNSTEKLKAVWSMRQAYSQVEYLLDVGGLTAIPEESKFTWPGDKRFVVAITKKDLKDIKPSQFLVSALKIYNFTNSNGNQNLNVDEVMGSISQLLDNPANTSGFANVFVNIKWLSGVEKRLFTDGLFLIDNSVLSNLKLPSLNNNPTPDNPPNKGGN
jgi:prepilin-type N-terminal cleavage/methylation domain-containing protein